MSERRVQPARAPDSRSRAARPRGTLRRVWVRLLGACVLLAAQPGAVAGEFVYVRQPTRAETRTASLKAIGESFGLDRFKQSPWRYAGPFDNSQGRGLDAVYPPERGVDLKAEYTGVGGRKIRWKDGSAFTDGEAHDCSVFEVRDFVTCYLYRTIESDRNQPATLSVGSDDCIAVWLNGTKVHDFRGVRGTVVDQDVVPVNLRAGTNHVLLKVSNFQMGIGFAYRLSSLSAAGLGELNQARKRLERQLDLDFPNPEADYYRIETVNIPPGVVLEVSGMGFTPDGRLVMCTRRGEIWSWNPPGADWKLFASGLHEPLGLWPMGNGDVVVAQRPELTRVRDTDGDGRADAFETLTDAFGLSGNYHEFHFGPVRDREGNFYATLNCSWEGLAMSRVPFRGWAYKLTPGGVFVPFALGFRSPVGIGLAPGGDIFVTDSQGDWWGTSPLVHLQQGKFYGHPASLAWAGGYQGPENPHLIKPEQLEPLRTLPAVWVPYNQMGYSPTEPVWDTTGGKFGPFTGQMFAGDSGKSVLSRVVLEKVGGEFQGAIFPFRAGFASGLLRAAFASDGTLYVGQTDRGWGSVGGRSFALQRVSWTGRVPFEIHRMTLRNDGFDLHFTAPVDAAAASRRAAYSLQHFHYVYYHSYGSAKTDVAPVLVKEVRISTDGKTVTLVLPELAAPKVYELHISGLKSGDGRPLLHPEAYYTLNKRVSD